MYQIAREMGTRFCMSRRDAAETAVEWARTYPGEITVWNAWWVDPERPPKAVQVLAFPGDTVSYIEGQIALLDDKFVPKPPQGPGGGTPLPIPLLKAA